MDWGQLVNNVAPALVSLGSGLIMNNQIKKDAIGQANAQQALLDTQYQIALQNERNLLLAKQQGQAPADSGSNNTVLYVVIGVSALLLVGLIVVVAKVSKKE